jgi:HlyD family secretion protein
MSHPNDSDRPVVTARADAPADRNGPPALRDRVRSLRIGEKRKVGGSAPLWLLPWGLCLILAGVAAAFGYRAYSAPAAAPAADSETSRPGASESPGGSSAIASTGEVALKDMGYIIPAHQIQVSPLVGGRLIYLDENLVEGRQFKQGDVLARLEDTQYRSDYDNAERAYTAAQKRYQITLTSRPEEIEQAEADLAEARATADQAQKKFRRTTTLMRTNSATQEDYDADQATAISADKRVKRVEKALELMKKAQRTEAQEAAKADMEAAAATLRKAKWLLDQCEIRAPVSGTILKKAAEKGNYVNPSAFSTGISASLCDMADLSDLEVDLKVQERDIAQVRKGQICAIMPQAYQSDEEFLKVHPKGYEGYVSRLMPTADRGQGAIPVRVKLTLPKDEEGRFLRPDMSVMVVFKKK